MISAITLYQLHGEKHLRVLTDGEVPIEEQKRAFKLLQNQREHPEYARVELWTSACRTKAHKFKPAAEVAAATEEEPASEASKETNSENKDAGGDAAENPKPKSGQTTRRRSS